MGVSKNNGTPKSSHFNRVFHYKPSILGYPYFPHGIDSNELVLWGEGVYEKTLSVNKLKGDIWINTFSCQRFGLQIFIAGIPPRFNHGNWKWCFPKSVCSLPFPGLKNKTHPNSQQNYTTLRQMQRSRNYYIKTFKDICKPIGNMYVYLYVPYPTDIRKIQMMAGECNLPEAVGVCQNGRYSPSFRCSNLPCCTQQKHSVCTIRYSNLLCTMQSFTTKFLAHSRLKNDTENEQSTSRWFKVHLFMSKLEVT